MFLLKTFFFIYLGISLHFDRLIYVLIAAAIVLPVYAGRFVIVRLLASRSNSPRDASLMTTMVPKGLAAAVLATLPVQAGLPMGEWVPGVVYMVVLISITLTALLVLLVEKTPVQRSYTAAFHTFRAPEPPTSPPPPEALTEPLPETPPSPIP